MKGRSAARITAQAIDPRSFYATLGLNPYCLRFISEDTFESSIKGVKREITKKIHPDIAKPSLEELDYLKRMLEACNVLVNKDSRNQYSTWLK